MGRERVMNVLRAGIERQSVRVDFTMTVNGTELDLSMRNPDMYEMARMQEVALARGRAEAAREGLTGLPVDEERWRVFKEQAVAAIKGRTQRKQVLDRLEKDKPRDLADQIAKEGAWLAAARRMIPKVLYCGDELLFCDEASLALYEDLMKNSGYFSLLVSKFTELVALSGEVDKAAKNSRASSGMN